MRTTLTLDDDIAARLEQMRERKRMNTREIVNLSLRAGLDQLELDAKDGRSEYKIISATLGKKLHNLDNVAEVLELMDAE
jgi:hypothetical protein